MPPRRLRTLRAHPRSRGEHWWPLPLLGVQAGSSPLARGTHPRHANPSCLRGLIPARAGNTLPRAVESQTPRAHPRSRGEHVAFGALLDDGVGSSPLARGTQFSRSQGTGSQGLIPARAGNTSPRPLGRTLRGAHPRSRGEHLVEAHNTALESGSSPLARGTLNELRQAITFPGLIPARAGNTSEPASRSSSLWAHPRSRGEHHLVDNVGVCARGSSPLARGTPDSRTHHGRPAGLIPARAGNTFVFRVAFRFPRAHPRSRGEHFLAVDFDTACWGSSPLARGTR